MKKKNLCTCLIRICVMIDSTKTINPTYIPSRVAICSNVWLPFAIVHIANGSTSTLIWGSILFLALIALTMLFAKKYIHSKYTVRAIAVITALTLTVEASAITIIWLMPSIMLLIGFAILIPMLSITCLRCAQKRIAH